MIDFDAIEVVIESQSIDCKGWKFFFFIQLKTECILSIYAQYGIRNAFYW